MPEKGTVEVTLPRSGEKCTVSLRRSEKARRSSLRVTDSVAELVLPLFMPEKEALSFLSSCLPWLETTLKKRRKRIASHRGGELSREYPARLDFAALNRVGTVFYTFLDVPWVGVRWDEGEGDRILVTGNVLSPEGVGEALERFVLREAEKFLPEKLEEAARLTGTTYETCAVRLQSSRWGSCSGKGTISLNAMLLFVPEECVHYVLIHELCHTRHMDHSASFWREVAKYVPEWKYLRSLLKRTPIPVLHRKKGN